MKFACSRGHEITAVDWTKSTDGGPRPDVDLTGYYCPVCMGQIVGHGDMIDSRILAPVQNDRNEAEATK